METPLELNLARPETPDSGNVLDALRDLVPGAVELIGGCITRRLDRRKVRDERIQLNDLAVRMQDVDSELAWNERRDRRHIRIIDLFAHHDGMDGWGASSDARDEIFCYDGGPFSGFRDGRGWGVVGGAGRVTKRER